MSPGLHRRPYRRRTLLLALAAAALVVVVAAVLVHGQLRGRDDVSPPAATPAETEQRQPLPDESLPPETDLLPGNETSLVTTCGVTLPVSQRHGPSGQDGQRRYGFGREPAGAVLAALHLAVQVSPQTGPEVFVWTLAEQVTGPDAAVFTQRVHDQYELLRQRAGVPYGQPLCPIYGRFAGFRLDSYHEDAASLRLLVQAPGPDGVPQLASVVVQLSWLEGDWRLVAPPAGDWSRVSTLQPGTAIDQYTPLGR